MYIMKTNFYCAALIIGHRTVMLDTDFGRPPQTFAPFQSPPTFQEKNKQKWASL